MRKAWKRAPGSEGSELGCGQGMHERASERLLRRQVQAEPGPGAGGGADGHHA